MVENKKAKREREMPRAHLLHIGCALAIILLIVLDMVFNLTTRILPGFFIPWYVSVGLCILILIFALLFIIKSHNALFSGEDDAPNHVITDGVFDQVRHPMYIGILLIHLAFITLTMSLIAFGAWIVVIIIYNRMASYEEKVLEEMFGDEYREYKKRTSKWIPR
ncbi:MAG: isoprenylcysteine carboxylmethyltransferase family protein [Candidatus Helarchaeota archaeon]|nr:isoprenylcysteine carboxylmethyltransferase family protein [Candidatus Helarchaeota archaeon]